KALLHAHLTMPGASRAGGGRGPRLGAGTMAGIAAIPGRHADGGIKAVGGLFQRNFQVVAQVGAAVDLRSAAGAGAPENIPENVAERIRAAARASAAAHVGVDPRMAVTVVGVPLLRIGQHLVSFL